MPLAHPNHFGEQTVGYRGLTTKGEYGQLGVSRLFVVGSETRSKNRIAQEVFKGNFKLLLLSRLLTSLSFI